MKKLIAGLGLTFAVVSPAHAHGWSGEDMRTMEANEHGPIVHVKSVHISGNGWHGGRYHTNPASYQCHEGVCQGGWRVLGAAAPARVQAWKHVSPCGAHHPVARFAPQRQVVYVTPRTINMTFHVTPRIAPPVARHLAPRVVAPHLTHYAPPPCAPCATGWQRSATVSHPAWANAQQATRRVQRVTSERVYVQRVTRLPPHPTCPLAY